MKLKKHGAPTIGLIILLVGMKTGSSILTSRIKETLNTVSSILSEWQGQITCLLSCKIKNYRVWLGIVASSPYSPNLDPSNYHLFRSLIEQKFEREKFSKQEWPNTLYYKRCNVSVT